MDDLFAEADRLTNAEVRRRRLAQLVNEYEGGLKALAAAAGVSAQNLDHILKRRTQSKARADGRKPLVAMGDQVARDIEVAAKKAPGWMDWPFEHVPIEDFLELNLYQQAAVEGQMLAAINDAKGRKVHSGALRPAVSNEKVEKHFKALPQGAAEAARRQATTVSKVRRKNPKEPELPFGGPRQ